MARDIFRSGNTPEFYDFLIRNSLVPESGNSISKNLSIDLNRRYNSEIITVDPGNVQTGMNTKGLLDSNKCAEYIIDIIDDKKNDLNGKFIDLFKKEISW